MRTPPARHRFHACGALLLTLLAAPAAVQAQTPANPSLQACTEIGPPADRLACYDKAMGRAPRTGGAAGLHGQPRGRRAAVVVAAGAQECRRGRGRRHAGGAQPDVQVLGAGCPGQAGRLQLRRLQGQLRAAAAPDQPHQPRAAVAQPGCRRVAELPARGGQVPVLGAHQARTGRAAARRRPVGRVHAAGHVADLERQGLQAVPQQRLRARADLRRAHARRAAPAAVRLAVGATRSWAWPTSPTASPTRCRAAGTASTWRPVSSGGTGRWSRGC